MIGNALGIESPEKLAAAREAEGKAIGGACRNAARGIEDCFSLNRKADKAAMFAGWREMNDYMRENKLDATPSQATTEVAGAKPSGPDGGEADPEPTKGDAAAKAPGKTENGKRPKARDS